MSLNALTIAIRLRFGVNLVLVALFAYVYVGSDDFADLARYFPQLICAAGGVLAVASFLADWRARRLGDDEFAAKVIVGSDLVQHGRQEADNGRSFVRRAAALQLGFIGYLVCIAVFGVMLATMVFLFLSLTLVAKWRLITAGLVVVVVNIALGQVSKVMGLLWPEALWSLDAYLTIPT